MLAPTYIFDYNITNRVANVLKFIKKQQKKNYKL